MACSWHLPGATSRAVAIANLCSAKKLVPDPMPSSGAHEMCLRTNRARFAENSLATNARPKTSLLLAATVVAVAAAAGYFGAGPALDFLTGAAGSEESDREPQAVRVAVAEARERTIDETVAAVGTARAIRSVEIRPEQDGRIVEIAFRAGERVEAGAVLARLDDRAERAALAEARAALADAEGTPAREQELVERGVTSEATLESTRAAYRTAEAAVERAREALADRILRAPFSGTTDLTPLDEGQFIEAGTRVTTLDDLTSVEIAFAIPEPYFARVAPGLAVEARSAAFPQRVFSGAIDEVGTRIDPATRAFPVRATLQNHDGALASGLFMQVGVVLETRRAVVVPEESVLRLEDAAFVFLAEDGTARRREVTVGARSDGDLEIVDGLRPGARVLTGGLQDVEDGSAITVESDESGGAREERA
jgi:membrane fusion protein (multidrug efflux system)